MAEQPEIRPGQVYEECLPEGYLYPRRIRVVGQPCGSKVAVASLEDGREMRHRALETSQLHATAITRAGMPRRTGYRLVQDVDKETDR